MYQIVYFSADQRIDILTEKAKHLQEAFTEMTGLECRVEPKHVYNNFSMFSRGFDNDFRFFVQGKFLGFFESAEQANAYRTS